MANFENNPGLKDLVEVIDLGFDVVAAIKTAKANDGKINLMDFPVLLPLFESTSNAIEGIENALPAWQAASFEDRNLVIAHFNERFDLPNDKLEAKIEKILLAATIILSVILDQED